MKKTRETVRMWILEWVLWWLPENASWSTIWETAATFGMSKSLRAFVSDELDGEIPAF